MSAIAVGLLVAGLLPYVATVAAKAGKGYSNREPRLWLAAQEGWRRRANAAQLNLFESLPFFFAAVLFALYQQAEPQMLALWVWAWIAARLLYIACYIADRSTLRSLVWCASLAINITILFIA